MDSLSRLPVGSSARISDGDITRARATATRCCWPPESWFGWWPARSAMPTTSSAASARSRRSRRGTRAYAMGSSTLASAVVLGIRLKAWNTKPIRRLRTMARACPSISATSRPSRRYRPAVGTSRQPRRFISVDLPDPETPMTATESPCSTVRSTPRRACTTASPTPYVLVAARTSMTGTRGVGQVARDHERPPGAAPGGRPPRPPPREPAEAPGTARRGRSPWSSTSSGRPGRRRPPRMSPR